MYEFIAGVVNGIFREDGSSGGVWFNRRSVALERTWELKNSFTPHVSTQPLSLRLCTSLTHSFTLFLLRSPSVFFVAAGIS